VHELKHIEFGIEYMVYSWKIDVMGWQCIEWKGHGN
jgi:hypothetical protein